MPLNNSGSKTMSMPSPNKSLRIFSLLSLVVLVFVSFANDMPSTIRILENNSDGEISSQGQKKVAFMFLSTEGIHHDAVWENWFLRAGEDFEDKASIYVHASDADNLRISPTLTPFFNKRVIPAVQTKYYKNLLDGMIQVLLYAYADPDNTHFVFISDSSIPVKSFDDVYAELVNDEQSRFCLRSNERAHWVWSRFPSLEMPMEYHREAEMWSSLSRNHVAEVVKRLNSDIMVWQRANTDRNVNSPGPYAGAPDETFLPTFLQKFIGTEAFNTCHGTVTETDEEDLMEQNYMGCCPTYLDWPGTPRHEVTADGCEATSVSSPCLFKKVYNDDLKTLSDAGFLFMRKVAKDAVFVDKNGNEMPLTDSHTAVVAEA